MDFGGEFTIYSLDSKRRDPKSVIRWTVLIRVVSAIYLSEP